MLRNVKIGSSVIPVQCVGISDAPLHFYKDTTLAPKNFFELISYEYTYKEHSLESLNRKKNDESKRQQQYRYAYQHVNIQFLSSKSSKLCSTSIENESTQSPKDHFP